MRPGADAAPSRSPNVGLTTLVLAGVCLLGLATSQAVAQGFPQQTPTEPTSTTVAAAPAPPPPAPDPKPAPRPDPKPARPKQVVHPKAPPPPPPPPPVERATRQPITTTAPSPTTSPKPRVSQQRAAPTKRPATPPSARPRRQPRRGSAVRVRRDRPPVGRRKPVVTSGNTQAAPAEPALDLARTPLPVLSQSQPSTDTAIPIVLLLLSLGIVLLLGASVASSRRVPWPELAEPLYAHRRDLATFGAGAIALAFLWLNAAILL